MEKQNSELKFEVGKKYKHVSEDTIATGLKMSGKNGEFTCHSVDRDGDCWSKDVEFEGKSGDRYCGLFRCHGWFASAIEQLQSGEVIEVTE